MEDLSIDSIMSEEEVANLFSDIDETETKQDTQPEKESDNSKEEKDTTEEISPDDLFMDTSESVGSEEHTEVKEDTTSKKSGTSPNIYSSIAQALKEDGVFPDSEDSDIKGISQAEDFAEFFEKQVQKRLDERQQRIDAALSAGVEDSVVRSYENTLKYLDTITEDSLKEESQESENLRKQLIYQDLINKGATPEEAKEDLQDILDNGTDIKKAVRALNSNKEFFERGYQKVIEDAKEEAAKEEKERKQQAETLKKSIMEDSALFGDLSIDKSTRQKVLDNISKPVYKDKETGELFTAIQKYEMENKTEFLKNVGILFTLTDGFKNLDKLIQPKVNKEVKKSLRELEHTLNNTARNSDGTLKFVSGVGEDSNSYFSNWNLDI